MTKAIFLFTITSLMFVLGCGNKTAQQVADQIRGKSNQTRNELGISGDWQSECSKTSIIPNFKSQSERYHFGDDGTFQKKFYFYSDENCQNPSFVRQEDGTLTLHGSATPKEGIVTDFSFTKVSIIPDNKGAVTILNSLDYCGVNSYAIGVATDVTAQSSNTLCKGVKHTPRTTYDIIKLTDDSHLVMGEDGSQEDAKARPQNVDTTLVFSRF